jgi:hypothetical protein
MYWLISLRYKAMFLAVIVTMCDSFHLSTAAVMAVFVVATSLLGVDFYVSNFKRPLVRTARRSLRVPAAEIDPAEREISEFLRRLSDAPGDRQQRGDRGRLGS